jgi:chitin synthase
MIVMALIVSLTTPVDRGIAYFNFLMGMFGVLLLLTMVGIIFYLTQTGFYPAVKEYVDDGGGTGHWITHDEERHFSILMLSGVVMCGVFIIPMILRPLDFLSNFRNYIIGLFSYLFMMPTFINIMQIYAMCNLHDLSWGNRPATS